MDICMSATPKSEPRVGGLFFTVLFFGDLIAQPKACGFRAVRV